MIAQSFKIIRENVVTYLVMVLILMLVLGLQDSGYMKSGGSAGIAVVWLILARFIHRSALTGSRFGDKNLDGSSDTRFGSFIFKGFVLAALTLGLSLAVLLSLAPPLGTGMLPVHFLILIASLIVTYPLVLALLGSWLPADVYGQAKGLGAALSRAKSNFLAVFVRLFGIMLLGMLLPMALVPALMAAGIPIAMFDGGKVSLGGVTVTLLLQVLQCVCLTMTCVVLSRYYLAYEGLAAER